MPVISSTRAGAEVRVGRQWPGSDVLLSAWAPWPFSLGLQKRPGSLIADRASCPGARGPTPVPQPAATLREALAALEAPGDLDGVGAGAGARARGQDRNVERCGLGYASNGEKAGQASRGVGAWEQEGLSEQVSKGGDPVSEGEQVTPGEQVTKSEDKVIHRGAWAPQRRVRSGEKRPVPSHSLFALASGLANQPLPLSRNQDDPG